MRQYTVGYPSDSLASCYSQLPMIMPAMVMVVILLLVLYQRPSSS